MRNEPQNVKKEKSFSSINLKSFILVSVILVVIVAIAGIITNFIPQGHYQYDQDGKIIPNTFVYGSIQGIAFWRVITAPVRVFASEDALTIIMICLFLLVMSGVFNIMEKTKGVQVLISKSITKFSQKKFLVILITVFFFMVFGSFFGMFEELVTLLPIILIFMLSMGFDTLTGLGVCMLSACFGFAAAITNPFSVGLASNLAGTPVFEGVWLRIIFFVLVFAILCTFLLLHVKKISRNPEKSLTFEMDREKLKSLNLSNQNIPNEGKIFKTYAIFFSIQLVVLILVATIRAISDYAIPILAVTFLVGGIVSGLIVSEKKSKVFIDFLKGTVGMLPAVVLLAVASSVKLILVESNIIDTIMYTVITALSGKDKFVCILLIYFLILFLQIFIGSASAKIMLIMPIILPICTSLGLSPALVILTYCMADGFTDMIIPTNPILLLGLSFAGVSYGKWIRWTWLLQLILFLTTILVLFFAVSVGYGL
ncbi:MAG: YfcC family protein [Clostridiales bacterium]|nr:YfcC family protein [Clostridiales bacterium]